jgi:hypothetical protein
MLHHYYQGLPCCSTALPLPLSPKALTVVAGIIEPQRLVDRVVVAEAESGGAGSASARLPAQRRDVRRAGGRVRGRHRHGLEISKRYRRPARGPRPEAAQGGPGRQEGRVRLHGGGRDADSHRPGRCGPALLLRQAQDARHEPAGHRRLRRRSPVGVGGAARLGARQKAEWIWGVLDDLEAAGLVTLAGKGCQVSGYGKIRTRGRTSRNPRNGPIRRTRNYAHLEKG